MSDQHRQEFSSISILVGNTELRDFAIYPECSFSSVAGAQPGTATISVRDPYHQLSFTPGNEIRLTIDGVVVWSGILLMITRGDVFPAGDGSAAASRKTRKWTLSGSDWNILFDKLIIYNHTDPALRPHFNALFNADATDRNVLISTIRNDTDLTTLPYNINYQSKIVETGVYSQDGKKAAGPDVGSTLRGAFELVATSVDPEHLGALVWYIDPKKYIVYHRQDADSAPFSVADGAGGDVSCRDLTITTDISSIRNDVLVLANELNPIEFLSNDPTYAKPVKPYVKWVHNSLSASVSQYGRFQYAEIFPAYSVKYLRAYSNKLLSQQGTPAERATFTVFRPGLYPGQIMTLSSDAFGYSKNVPVRAVETTFPTPNIAQYRITASFDTMDPWGLLTALRKPTKRGFIQPRFQTIHDSMISSISAADFPRVDPFTFLREVPKSLGSNKFQTKFPYIRNSMTVTVGGLFKQSGDDYEETDPDTGTFKLLSAPSGQVFVMYHTQES